MVHRWSRAIVLSTAMLALLSAACAYPKTRALQKWDLRQGYRFPLIAQHPKNSEQLFVVLAFSGGGTRAAAMSYGVLHELERVRFHWNEQTGAAEPCAAGDPRCRSLLDEVDVISSVSGGSFTSAYYAYRGKQIFNEADPFHTRFLYAPVQRELFARAVHYPQNWPHLAARVEIAAKEHASRLFGDTTFAALERTRPYIILNGTDMSTGARFEFTQDQFDLICGDLSAFPIARAVAASSAFPGLLNSMTIDTHTGQCQYMGPGTNQLEVDWVDQSVKGRAISYRRYKAGRDVAAVLDEERKHLHILDGGLADNVGARSVLRSLSSIDAPMDAAGNVSGWSLLTRVNTRVVRHIIVIGVNAKTEKTRTWDERSAGPGTLAVLDRATSVPMSSFTAETLDLLREYADDAVLNQPGRPKFHAFEVAFENIPGDSTRPIGQRDMERQFFLNMPTTFELSRHEVDCLKERGASLLREALSIEHQGKTFDELVRRDLAGHLEGPALPRPAGCNTDEGPRRVGVRSHYLDIGAQWTLAKSNSDDVEDKHGVGVIVRLTRPDGFGVLAGYGTESFSMQLPVGSGSRVEVGNLLFRSIAAGVAYSWHRGRVEASPSVTAGYGFGGFEPSTEARDAYGRMGVFGLKGDATNGWLVQPAFRLSFNLTNRLAAMASVGYSYARPTLRVEGDNGFLDERKVRAAATRFSIGLGVSPF